MNNLYLIAPIYNEALNIPLLINSFKLLDEELGKTYTTNFILIDDGSIDNSTPIARELVTSLPFTILTHEINKGPGAAFATVFSYLATKIKDEDLVITMEGDNTSDITLIKKILTRAEEGFDVVLASPYMYGGGFVETSLLRRLLSSGANLIVKDLLDLKGLLTVSSFFRLYKGSILLKMQKIFGLEIIERVGFESMVEMTMKLVMIDATISEVAMKLDSSKRKGKSKMKIVKTILGYLALLKYKNVWKLKTL